MNNSGNAHTARVLDDVSRERDTQKRMWSIEHDDDSPLEHFLELISERDQNIRRFGRADAASYIRHRFIEIAALAVAAVESIDRRVEVGRIS